MAPGDTLSELACFYDTTVANLQNLNGLGSSTLIRVGQKLTPGDSPFLGLMTVDEYSARKSYCDGKWLLLRP